MSTERGRRRTDRVLTLGIAIILTAIGVLMYIGWRFMERRTRDIQLEVLDQGLARSEAGLAAYVQSIHDRLELEAGYLFAHDTVAAPVLLERWAAIMRADWACVEVRIASESGQEIALLRADSSWQVIRTDADSMPSRTRVDLMDDTGRMLSLPDTLAPSGYDPRMQAWFSQALQNHRPDPVWNIPRTLSEGEPLRAHVAILIRSRTEGRPHRILQLTFIPERSGHAVFGGNAAPELVNVLLLGPAHPIVQPSNTPDIPTHAVLERALASWGGQRRKLSIDVELDGHAYLGRFKPFTLNGETIFLGGILPLQDRPPLLQNARGIILAGSLLQTVLVVLLIWLFRRKRGDVQRLREEQRQSRKQQKKLAKALGERDMLDREVHHRVKNNLQVVSSLLSLQAGRLEDGPVKAEFMRGKRRIDNMALVHHKLYGLTDLRGIDLQGFFGELNTSLATLHLPHSQNISCTVNANEHKADPDTAIALGQILCELLTNCYQHAFPYSTGGHIDVSLQQVETTLFRLVVKDNGRGMAAQPGGDQGRLGLEITEALAGQLDGGFKAYTDGGVTFEVLFRMEPLT